MKICHIITTLDFGGAERLLLYLAQEQSENHEFHIIYLKDKNAMQPMFPKSVKTYYAALGWSCASEIRSIVKQIQPDVVHTHLGHADWFGLWALRNTSVKKICTIHNIWYKWNWTDYVIFFIYRVLFATVANDCKVIGITKSIDTHIATRFGVPNNRRALVYNAVPPLALQNIHTKQQARELLNLDNSTYYALFVGRFEKQKSVHTLIEAAALFSKNYPQIKVLLVGDGTLREELEKQVARLKLSETITFIGKHSNPEIFMQAADVLLLPSIFEGLPLVVLEAFRVGLPVITTKIETLQEIITQDVNGLLCEPENPQQLADCIEQIYNSPALREQMSQNARSLFLQKYDIKQYALQLEKLYESA